MRSTCAEGYAAGIPTRVVCVTVENTVLGPSVTDCMAGTSPVKIVLCTVHSLRKQSRNSVYPTVMLNYATVEQSVLPCDNTRPFRACEKR